MATGKRKFLWGSQLRDNVFWSCASGCTVWTAYEVLMTWAYANGLLPYGEPDIPFDHWFGTSHDGSPEAHASMREKRRARNNVVTDSD